MSFLGLIGPWICDFAEISQPLCDITHGGQHLAMTDLDSWHQTRIYYLKQALSSVSRLTWLYQTFQSLCLWKRQRSKCLSTTDGAMVACLRAVAAATEAVLVTADIVAMCTLTVTVTTQAEWFVDHVSPNPCTVLNTSSLLPAAEEGEPHSCLEVVDITSKPCDDLFDPPSPNPDMILFVDGLALHEGGTPQVSYAACNHCHVLESAHLPGQLFALTRVFILWVGNHHLHWLCLCCES